MNLKRLLRLLIAACIVTCIFFVSGCRKNNADTAGNDGTHISTAPPVVGNDTSDDDGDDGDVKTDDPKDPENGGETTDEKPNETPNTTPDDGDGKTPEEKPAEHVHKYSLQWTAGEDGKTHYHCCEGADCNSVRDVQSHTWNSGSQTAAPNCTEAGSAEYECIQCGYVEPREIAAIGHSFTNLSHDEEAHWYVCANDGCGELTDKVGHDNLGEGGKCSVCGYKEEVKEPDRTGSVELPFIAEEGEVGGEATDLNGYSESLGAYVVIYEYTASAAGTLIISAAEEDNTFAVISSAPFSDLDDIDLSDEEIKFVYPGMEQTVTVSLAAGDTVYIACGNADGQGAYAFLLEFYS